VRVWRSCAIAGMLVLAVVSAVLSAAKAQQPAEGNGRHDEYTVKAVFLYSFGRYVEWPKSAFANGSAPFVIGIVGEDSFGGVLGAIAKKKTIQDRRIVIRRFDSPETYSQPCQILFVSKSLTAEQQAAIIARTEGQPVLVVGETPGFAERGAIANFYTEGDRVLFEINVEAARKSHLRMDAKLLSLGKTVGAGAN
jgi:hypothetical protein